VADAIAEVPLERYPDPRALRLKEAIAKRTGASANALMIGAGSDELIALLSNAFATPQTTRARDAATILTTSPTFVMYRMTALTHGLRPIEVPLDDTWDIDAAAMVHATIEHEPKLAFVASPNNPTSNSMSRDRMETLIAACERSKTFVVADEAYIDYAAPRSSLAFRASSTHSQNQRPHVGVLRTMSKVGFASLRLGWLEADPALIAELDKTRQPFNVNAATQAAMAAVLEHAWDEVQKSVTACVAARDALACELGAREGFEVTPSDANFLWVRTPMPAERVMDHLVRHKILVRSFHRAGGRLANCLRITVGTEAQHERLLRALDSLEATP